MPLSNTVARGAGDPDGAERRWEAPVWAEEAQDRED
jgi:hypothetical protein